MSILLALTSIAHADIRVAVLEATDSETSSDVAAQLNDDTWFDFTATVVSVDDVDEATELANYDVIVMGGSGYGAPYWTSTFISALDTWVRGGGGMIASSWFHYTTDNSSYGTTIDGLVPIDISAGGYEYCSSTVTMTVDTSTGHPALDGIKNPLTTASNNVEISSYALEKGATSLVTANGGTCSSSSTNHAGVAWEVDSGRVMYLGILYTAASGYNNADTRSGDLDRLLEQSVYWVSTGGDMDEDGFFGSEDCDDTNPDINPDATEIWYDGVDQNCDEWSDYDADLDSYDTTDSGGLDCDDKDPDVNPDGIEVWYDGIDQDCDEMSDYDADLDGYDTTDIGGLDCDDTDPDVNPLGYETWYDGIDQDCDGGSDYDADQDGYDSDAYGGDDCDDADPTFGPGVDEIWYDGTDQDCDGGSDYDADQDGYDGNVDDCDDKDATIHPGAEEIANDGIDQDCDDEDLIEDKAQPSTTCATVSSPNAIAMLAVGCVLGLCRRRRRPLSTP